MNGSYLDWGVVQISMANLVVIAIMVVVFLLSVIVPFHGPRSSGRDHEDQS
jgi:uncharacterized membrane protein